MIIDLISPQLHNKNRFSLYESISDVIFKLSQDPLPYVTKIFDQIIYFNPN